MRKNNRDRMEKDLTKHVILPLHQVETFPLFLPFVSHLLPWKHFSHIIKKQAGRKRVMKESIQNNCKTEETCAKSSEQSTVTDKEHRET